MIIYFVFEKSFSKCFGESSPRPICKKSKLSVSLDQLSESYKVCFYCTSNQDLPKYVKTNALTTCFKKQKEALS